MRKRLISCLLAIVLILSVFAISGTRAKALTTINTIEVYGYKDPIDVSSVSDNLSGYVPHNAGTGFNTKYYISNKYWIDVSNSNKKVTTGNFVVSRTYQLVLEFTASYGYQFDSNTTVNLNGASGNVTSASSDKIIYRSRIVKSVAYPASRRISTIYLNDIVTPYGGDTAKKWVDSVSINESSPKYSIEAYSQNPVYSASTAVYEGTGTDRKALASSGALKDNTNYEINLVFKANSGYIFEDCVELYVGDQHYNIYSSNMLNHNSILCSFSSTTKKNPLGTPVEQFVKRLYKICLNREADAEGLKNWTNQLEAKVMTGVQVANGFVFSPEFKNMNLCNNDYVESLYKAFLGRASDPAGKKDWVKQLESGVTREAVFNGFALSNEFKGICESYGIVQGSAIPLPKYGTIPTGKCKVCGKEDGVTSFVKRLYKVCLDRNADAGGLKNWCNQLWNHVESGSSVAYGFIFSPEFVNKKYSNADYVEHLYQAFMGRASDSAGKADWVGKLNSGWTRKQVFDGFVGSQEFTKICQSYGIMR